MVPLNAIGCPGLTGFGEADPVAVGGVGSELKLGVTLTLSIAMPSSEPGESISVHLIQIEAPGFTDRPVIVVLTATRHGAEWPSVAPATLEHAFPGEAKSRAARFVNVPVVRSEADVLYEKVRPSAFGVD
jgi:hypothetical protein